MRRKTKTTPIADSYFIAVRGDGERSQIHGVYGIGTSVDTALDDAYRGANMRPPSVRSTDDGAWIVLVDGRDEPLGPYDSEALARADASQHAFSARDCSERLYRYVERHGCDAARFTWVKGEVDDLDVDQGLVDQAVAEVEQGLEGCTAQGDWTADTALRDAHGYVDAYVLDDEGVDEDLQDAVREDAQLRVAVDVAVASIIRSEIEEREAA